MRRRHRHFNAGDAGAVCALDARFLSLNSGDAVSSWTDRSRNANSPTASSTVRPTYTANQIGGQPAVVFDGINDKLNFAAALWTLTFSFVCAVTYTKENVYGYILGQWASGQTGRSLIVTNQNSTGAGFFQDNINFFNSTQTGGAGYLNKYLLEATVSATTIISLTQTSGSENQKNYAIGSNVDSCTISSQYTGANTALGALSANQTGNFDGKIGSIAMFQSVLSDPLRKRCEHAAAYSFKISCN